MTFFVQIDTHKIIHFTSFTNFTSITYNLVAAVNIHPSPHPPYMHTPKDNVGKIGKVSNFGDSSIKGNVGKIGKVSNFGDSSIKGNVGKIGKVSNFGAIGDGSDMVKLVKLVE